MSARQVDVEEVVGRYATGFFPLYDPWDRFYWERLPFRAMVPVTAETAGGARRMKKRAWKTLAEGGEIEIRYTTAAAEVMGHLMDERVKERSWVRKEVVRIYEGLLAAGLLETIEVWKRKGGQAKLVGGLVGIVLPGTFIAETMFGLEGEASKVCVCQLVEDCWNAKGAGSEVLLEMIDVQTPHDAAGYAMLADAVEEELRGKTAHPCVRLGERTVPLRAFLQQFGWGWKNSFAGGVKEWIGVAGALQRAARAGEKRVGLTGMSAEGMTRAFKMLRYTLPAGFEPVFDQVE